MNDQPKGYPFEGTLNQDIRFNAGEKLELADSKFYWHFCQR
jgi:hypothetical protein